MAQASVFAVLAYAARPPGGQGGTGGEGIGQQL